MKKFMIAGVIVGLFVLTLGAAGLAYAQTQTPPADDAPYAHGMMGGSGFRGGFGGGMMGYGADAEGPMHEYMIAAMADAFGLTTDELEARHDAGETLWELAQEQNLTAEEFQARIAGARSTAIDQALADGVLTEEQAEWMETHMAQMPGVGFGPGGCHGAGVPGSGSTSWGRGGRGMRWNDQP
jgi:hypothetical protein